MPLRVRFQRSCCCQYETYDSNGNILYKSIHQKFQQPKKKKTIKVIYSNVRSNSILYIKNKVNTLCGSKITGLVSTNTKIVKKVI